MAEFPKFFLKGDIIIPVLAHKASCESFVLSVFIDNRGSIFKSFNNAFEVIWGVSENTVNRVWHHFFEFDERIFAKDCVVVVHISTK